MNILILTPFFPYPLNQGGKIRIFNIIKCLARNHQITLMCLSESKVDVYGQLSDLCEEVIIVKRKSFIIKYVLRFLFGKKPYNYLKYSSKAFNRTLVQLLKRKAFDLVHIELTLMWQYAYLCKPLPVVLGTQNIEHEIIKQIIKSTKNPFRKSLYLKEEINLREQEICAWKECSLCLTVSEKEKHQIVGLINDTSKIFTIPNGVDIEALTFHKRMTQGEKILFLGGMDYIPNLDSARYFLTEIFPLITSNMPDVRLHFVGRELWKIDYKAGYNQVEFHENVPDVRPWFESSDILVVPLRHGAGTRIKILEAMAAGVPVVTTSKGCEGIEVINNEHLLIADTSADFANAVMKLLSDKELVQKLTVRARVLVEERYSWDGIVKMLEELYGRIL